MMKTSLGLWSNNLIAHSGLWKNDAEDQLKVQILELDVLSLNSSFIIPLLFDLRQDT